MQEIDDERELLFPPGPCYSPFLALVSVVLPLAAELLALLPFFFLSLSGGCRGTTRRAGLGLELRRPLHLEAMARRRGVRPPPSLSGGPAAGACSSSAAAVGARGPARLRSPARGPPRRPCQRRRGAMTWGGRSGSTPARPSSSLHPRRGGSCSGAPTCPAWRSREAMAEQRARRRAGVRSGVADSRPWRAGASGGRPARGGGMERRRVRAMAGAPWPPWPARGGSRGAHGRGAGREPSSGAAAARRCGSKGDERMGEAAPLDRTWLST